MVKRKDARIITTMTPMIIITIGMWSIRAFGGGILCIRILGYGLPEAVICMLIESYIRLGMFYLRYRTGKWKYIIKDTRTIQRV